MGAIICFILALLCMGYYLFAALYAGFGSSFLSFWLVLSVLLFGLAFVLAPFHKKPLLAAVPYGLKLTLAVLAAAGGIFFCTMEALIIHGMRDTAEPGASYVVVLGAQVRGVRITKSLKKRLEAAKDYLEDNPEATAVCCGGQGAGEDITEAKAMRGWLVEQGIDEARILLEDQSTSTDENLKFARKIIQDPGARIVVVSNNFHIYRAKLIAKRAGFTQVEGLAAASDKKLFINYMVREAFALAKELILKR